MVRCQPVTLYNSGLQSRLQHRAAIVPPVAQPAAVPTMPLFTITTLGCKTNQYDSCAVASALADAGLKPATRDPASGRADLVVVNTCCVTTAAMRKSRHAIRQAVRASPQAVVFVTGCYADYNPERIRAILADLEVPEARIIVAGHHDDLALRINRLVRRMLAQGAGRTESNSCNSCCGGIGGDDISIKARVCAEAAAAAGSLHTYIRKRRRAAVKNNFSGVEALPAIRHFDGHQRAFVKVQDGCDAFCSYCIVPYTRWRVWSRSIEEVEQECRRLVEAGHKEIVLSGVFLGAFGRATALRRRWAGRPSKLPELVRRIAAIDGLWRVRLSSLEPADMTDELLAVCRETPRVAPHFHLPLQSGSQSLLRRMNRQYSPQEYRRTVDALREALDRPAVTTDIIVGFPGESEADFAETLDLARGCRFAKIHAFPFSAVAGTAAWTYRHEAAPPEVIRRRIAELSELEAELAADYRRQFLGQTMEGLVENARPCRPEERQAMTDRYQTIFFRADAGAEAGKVVPLKVTGIRRDGLAGEIAKRL